MNWREPDRDECGGIVHAVLKAGQLARDDRGKVYLIGDVNDEGGSCCHCQPLDPDQVVAVSDDLLETVAALKRDAESEARA